MNIYKYFKKNLNHTLILLGIFIVSIGLINLSSEKANAIERTSNNYCSKTIKTFKPKWAPNDWKIYCVKGSLDRKNKDDKNVLGITYSSENFIFIRDDIKDKHELETVIIHEWTHAAISSYRFKYSKNWPSWLSYIKNLPKHKNDYYGNPEEILAENTARCTLGYYYNYLDTEKAKCKVIHKLFPQLTTVEDKYDFTD